MTEYKKVIKKADVITDCLDCSEGAFGVVKSSCGVCGSTNVNHLYLALEEDGGDLVYGSHYYVNEQGQICVVEEEPFTIKRDEKIPQHITVTGEGVELVYWEVGEVGSNDLKRKWGTVNGVPLHTDRYAGYWCKAGRGAMKQKEKTMDMIRTVDTWLYNEKGFFFYKD